MKPRRRIVAFALALALACAAAGAGAAPLRVTDDRGRSVAFDAPPQRIVTLLPSLAEGVCALGACGRLVGVDRWTDWPDSLRALPRVGGGLDDIDFERVVALRPDVVLAARSTRAAERLESLGLKVVALDSDTHADVQRTLALLAVLLGHPEAGAAAWVRIQEGIAAAAARVPARLRGKRVYFEVESSPYAAGPASFVGQTLAALGLANAVPPELGPFPKLNPEFVVRHPPDIVMATQAALATMAGRPGWSSLPALQRGQACGFAPGRYELLIRPGPRLGEAAAVLADCLAALPAR